MPRRTGEFILLSCAVGPTRKPVEHSASTLPSEYFSAHGEKLPWSTEPNERKDEKLSARPMQKHATKPRTRSSKLNFGRQPHASLLELAEPIAFHLLDDLISADADGTEVWLERGGTLLEGEIAAEVYRWRNPGEVDANRNERQADLWESWLASIALADDLVAATLPFDSGLSPYLRALAIGESDIQLLPAVPNDAGSEPTYVLDENATAWLAETADRMVPLPIPAPGVDVATVRLLDGVGDPSIADEARAVVARLSELIVVGNAAEFGLPTTTVSYHDEADAPLAEALAAQLNAEVAADLRLDEPVDLTVTIGADWEIP